MSMMLILKGLTELALRFNQGINTDGDALKKRTHFNIAGAFNPNVRKLDGAVKRLEKKDRKRNVLFYNTTRVQQRENH